MKKFFFSIVVLVSITSASLAQVSLTDELTKINYDNPKEYVIGGVEVTGINHLDHSVIIHLSGLQVGDTISVPGEEITSAVENLWEQGLFSDVEIVADRIVNQQVFLNLKLEERPRLSKFTFNGVKKREADDLRENLKLTKGSQVTENLLMNINAGVKRYFVDKGFLNVSVDVQQEKDTTMTNNVILTINVNKGERIKIDNLILQGNEHLSDFKIKRAMKETKEKAWYNVFKSSKFISKDFRDDKKAVIKKYNEEGFRDARIIKDSIWKNDDNSINLKLVIDEGNKYYFREIDWIGNTKYNNEQLTRALAIERGDVYNQQLLDERLMGENSVFSLYQDNGYLFSNITPVEVNVEGDSIDLEMQIYEGKQAKINEVTINGNTRTNDHVVLREIRTRPGDLYKRSDIQRTIRELAQLGYFDPEKLNVDFEPDPEKGEVDLEYIVEEKPSDQIELSGGYGAGMIVGTLGLTFNNFSLQNVFNPSAYRPLPAGDGQRLSLRAQASGPYYQNYSFSFVEPWLGGRKPNSLSVSVYNSRQTYGSDSTAQKFIVTGASAGLGQRLEWPDDFFTLYTALGYKHYNIYQWSGFIYDDGTSNNINFTADLGRSSSGPNPIFPTRGSDMNLSVELTPPFSLLGDKDYSGMSPQEKYNWIEYHKWKFKGDWFTTLLGSKEGGSRALVLHSKFEFGFLAFYNSDVGPSPFEGFQLGGDGLYGYNLYGRETVGLRGYTNNSLTPSDGGNLYNKFSLELRYPLSLNPTATFYGLAFIEGGNAWYDFNNYNPFDLKRSAGFGIRVYMPMIGMLGVDWGYGFDEIHGKTGVNGSQFHFVIGQQF
ncbi:MAG: outer membrane protein assembly factor BamA [Bacteroidales bacterium]